MKRSERLRRLSEEHQRALVNARRLRRAAVGEADESPEAAATDFLGFWRVHAEPHFHKEEEVLIPLLALREPSLERSVIRMLLQHARIRGLVIELDEGIQRGHVRCETLRELGKDLETHIRLEEREVFPLLERTLPDEDLRRAERRMDALSEASERAAAGSLCFGPLPGPGNSEGGGEDWAEEMYPGGRRYGSSD